MKSFINKEHILLYQDFITAFIWFKENKSLAVAKQFSANYRNSLANIRSYPYHSHSLSTFHFFDEVLNDDNFRYLRLGTRTSYYLFNYISSKNYILACMSINLEGNTLADKLQFREQTKEVA
jgi:hypothetical protein